MNMEPAIKETKDLLAFVADLILAIDTARKDDAKVSFPEIAGIVTKNISGLISAVAGINKIPEEALTYTHDELEHLYDFFLTRMEWEPSDTNRDLAAAYFALIRDSYTNALRIYHTHRPPRAELA